MGDITYQAYFTNDDGDREYLNQNFHSEKKAEKAVDKLTDKGYDDADYESIDMELRDY
ncbi:hypothetical protein [Amphritea sp. HPY]|uniref:hypothetical protein n=1 Tax=Amphritea sp. HPY TaxID=3421652 RepID=UPI003D7DB4C0